MFAALRRITIVAVLLLVLLPVPSSSSAALNWCRERLAPHPERINGGALGAEAGLEWSRMDYSRMEFTPYTEDDPRGMYDSYGMAGQFWHAIQTKDCADDTRWSFEHKMATLTWAGVRGINTWTLRLFGWATNNQTSEIFTPLVVDTIGALRDSLWKPLVPLAVTLGAIWMIWVGLIHKRFTLSAQGAVWMVSATVLGLWILGSPETMINASTAVVQGGSGMVNAAVNSIDQEGTAFDCPGNSTKHLQQDAEESWAAYQSRETREMLWTVLQCRPWQAGVFGSDRAGQAAAEDYGYSVLRAQSVANGAPQEEIERKQEYFQEISEAIKNEHPAAYEHFRGGLPEQRFNIASAAMAGSLLAGGPIAIISAAIAIFEMAFLFGALFAPVFLLLGIAPGPGRRLLGQYAVVMGGILVAQIALLLILLVTMMSYGMIWSQEMELAERIIAMAVLFFGGLAFWVPLWQIVRGAVQNNRPDASRLGPPSALSTATRRSAETWRWKSSNWIQRKSRQASGVGAATGRASALAPDAATGASNGRQAPGLGEQEAQRAKLARGRGAPRPQNTGGQGDGGRSEPVSRAGSNASAGASAGPSSQGPGAGPESRSGGYRGSERSPEDAPTGPTPRQQERSQQQDAQVLRQVRAAEMGEAPRPQRVPPTLHPGPQSTTRPSRTPRPAPRTEPPPAVPPTQAPPPSRPPVRRRETP